MKVSFDLPTQSVTCCVVLVQQFTIEYEQHYNYDGYHQTEAKDTCTFNFSFLILLHNMLQSYIHLHIIIYYWGALHSYIKQGNEGGQVVQTMISIYIHLCMALQQAILLCIAMSAQ